MGDFIHFHSFRFYYMLMIYRCDFTSRIILLSYRSVYVAACWKSMLRWINSHLIFTSSILEFIIFHQICFSCVFSFKELPSYSPGCSNQALGVLLSIFLFLNQVLRGHTSQYLLNQPTSSLATTIVHTTITYVSYLKSCKNSFLTVLSASRLFFFQSVCTF